MPELAEVLARHGPEYRRRFGAALPPDHARAFEAIARCRTPALGGSVYGCTQCKEQHFAYHSCNHRLCPKCGAASAAAWREKRQAELLPGIPYFLVTFTLPAELRKFARHHPRLMYPLLFAQSAGSLNDAAANPRHLGGELGFLGVLHTWTRQLAYHPHVHYVVPGGGLRPDGRKWRKCRITKAGVPYLLPVQVLSARFRQRLAAALREKAPDLYKKVDPGVWRKDWVVHSQPAGRGQEALGYLSGYVQKSAITNRRILADDARGITISYKEAKTGQRKTLTLDPMAFIARVLSHALPAGLHRIRYFGWMHPRAKARLMQVQTLLSAPLECKAPEVHPPLHLRCPRCGKFSLKLIARLRRFKPP